MCYSSNAKMQPHYRKLNWLHNDQFWGHPISPGQTARRNPKRFASCANHPFAVNELEARLRSADSSILNVKPKSEIRMTGAKRIPDHNFGTTCAGASVTRLARRALLFLSLLSFVNGMAADNSAASPSNEPVGRSILGRIVTPVNQALTPVGTQVDLPGMRPQALALSPDAKILITAGKTPELVVLEPPTGRILQRVPLPSEETNGLPDAPASTHILKPDERGQLSFTGLIFSPDGSRIYLANVEGSIKVFAVGRDHLVTALHSFPLPPASAPLRKAEIPAGLALSRDDKRLYVALNLSNQLAELDAA